ncbi:MAG TPA: AAA family ATPase [Saprospiraceae bacterium]|nr:AAA family ATPase [Saprospiraceae bacterium]
MKYKNIYVAASSQHVGKTTTTLGLVYALKNQGIKVGYSKPVGQQFLDIGNLKVDKDILLFSDLIDFEIVAELHSPVILGKGATELFLDNPGSYDYKDRILNASEKLNEEYELVIYEGTGHPGVGTVAEISNARVAKMLDAGIVMVVEGGIGKTIDMMNMTTALFRESKVPIIGVVINKVMPEKIEKVRYYVGKWLDMCNIPLLGVVPYDKVLAYPLMETINKAIRGKVLFNEDKMHNKVANTLAGTLMDLTDLKVPEDILLISNSKFAGKAIDRLKMLTHMLKLEENPLAGIVLTGHDDLDTETLGYIERHKIPVVQTDLDTYSCVVSISKIEVKINRHTPWKVTRAINLIQDHVNLNALISNLK